LQADTQGYVTLYRLAEVLFVRLPKSQPKNRRPNSPSDCAPRLIPSAGEHPHKNPRLPHILTIGMLLPNAGYTPEETFVCPGVEKHRTTGKSRFYPDSRNYPFASAIIITLLHSKTKQGVFQVTVPHSYTSVNVSTSVSVSDTLLDSSYKMSVTATLVSRISIHIDASPISNILWPC
jgi:hypothetical protein